MTRFSHRSKGCSSEVVRYLGDGSVVGIQMRANEWQLPDGRAFDEWTMRSARCADCGSIVEINSRGLQAIEEPHAIENR